MKIHLAIGICSILCLISAKNAAAQNTTYNYDFGTGTGIFTSGASTNGFLPSPELGGGTNVVRIGTGGGQFQLVNPGSGSYLVGTAPTSGSINKFSIYNFDNSSNAFTLGFNISLSGGSSGSWYLFAGNGSTYESSTTTFSGSQVFTGLKFTLGASGSLAISNRAGGNWAALNGTGITQSNNYSIFIYGNNGGSSLEYNGNTLAADTYDLWVDGAKVGSGLSKAQLTNGTTIDSFMFYGENSVANVATVQLDDISYSNYAVPEPSTYALLGLAAAGLGAHIVRRRRR